MSYKWIKNHIEYWCERYDYEIEKVIQFEGDDILVIPRLALFYLCYLDVKNYIEGRFIHCDLIQSDHIPPEYEKLYWMYDLN